MANTVVGIFDSVNKAEIAVQGLINKGFYSNDIDISAQGSGGYAGSDTNYDKTDSFSKFFRNLFSDSDEADIYSKAGRKGAVVTVHAKSLTEAEQAADILDSYGAINADEHESQYGDSSLRNDNNLINKNNDFISGSNPVTGDLNTGTAYGTPETDYSDVRRRSDDLTYQDTGSINTDMNNNISGENRPGIVNDLGDTTPGITNDITDRGIGDINEGRNIPVIEEQLEVGKREVEKDRIRVRSRIFDKPVEENLRLRYEDVSVERVPVSRKATEADMKNFKDMTVETTESEEVPMVNKEARVVEEVRIRKDVKERDQTIRESVKRQDVDVERKVKDKEFRTGEGADL